MRLIDADKLIDYFYYGINDRPIIDGCNDRKIIDIIEEQPTAYDVDKVMDRLEELNKVEKSFAAAYDEDGRLDLMDIHDAKAEAYRNSRRIIKSGGIE